MNQVGKIFGDGLVGYLFEDFLEESVDEEAAGGVFADAAGF